MPDHTYSTDIDVALSRFVKYPAHLRKLLTETNAVISGSFAVQFFLHETWSDSDLDIDVGADPVRGPNNELQWTNAQKLVDYLEQIEGYDCAKEAGNYSARQEIEIVKSFYGPPHHSAAYGSPQIQLVLLKTLPTKHILTHYYATHILNFITGTAAYCLFPELTLAKKAVLFRDPGFYEEFFARKYGGQKPERGFLLLGPEEWAEVGERVIGDEETMVVSFGEGDNEEDVVRGVKFAVEKHEYGRDGEKQRGFRVTC
ncbi:hypothetical protein MBLNU457_g1012t1 [Dothideomycetes sp. NU457]